MNSWLTQYGIYLFVGMPMLAYIAQGTIVYAAQGRYGMCLAMLAYALANVGLILDAKGV